MGPPSARFHGIFDGREVLPTTKTSFPGHAYHAMPFISGFLLKCGGEATQTSRSNANYYCSPFPTTVQMPLALLMEMRQCCRSQRISSDVARRLGLTGNSCLLFNLPHSPIAVLLSAAICTCKLFQTNITLDPNVGTRFFIEEYAFFDAPGMETRWDLDQSVLF